ncbi:uncharacterized protein LOC128154635 isoform X1 [Harpia harpyja]|uniref:uncharacterized protein LOC128154635 isoform X1 n=1 Tax=Harpia harpyja TaxID=202280 RepID=UPI0022B09B07|nr:uncharacterized protein LOC128154635 isoform X1 [Harpia harpyja]
MGRTHLHGGFLACQDRGSCYWQRQREHRNLELVDSFPQTCGQTRKSSCLAFFVYWFPCLFQFALGMRSRTLCFLRGGLLVELELVCLFQNLQTGTRFPSRLVVFIKRYPVYPRCHLQRCAGQDTCWPWTLPLVPCFWLQPRKCCCYPKCSRNNLPAGNNLSDGNRKKPTKNPEECFAKTGLTNFKNKLEEVKVIWQVRRMPPAARLLTFTSEVQNIPAQLFPAPDAEYKSLV